MKKLFAIAAALILASCSGNSSSDGYTFEKESTLLVPAREVKVVLYPSLNAISKAYSERANAKKIAEGRDLMAFSAINGKTCTIHMIDPKVKYMPEFVGHELIHCLYGEFHPSQNG